MRLLVLQRSYLIARPQIRIIIHAYVLCVWSATFVWSVALCSGSLRKVRTCYGMICLASGKRDPYQGRLVTSLLQPQPLFYFPQPYVAGPHGVFDVLSFVADGWAIVQILIYTHFRVFSITLLIVYSTPMKPGSSDDLLFGLVGRRLFSNVFVCVGLTSPFLCLVTWSYHTIQIWFSFLWPSVISCIFFQGRKSHPHIRPCRS